MISDALRAEIRRLFYAEHWKVGTIAEAVHVHHDTVRRAIESERFGIHPARPRPSMLDPFIPFIRDTLQRYPRLRATRLYEMLRQRGYEGCAEWWRSCVRGERPRPICGCAPCLVKRHKLTGAASGRSMWGRRSGRFRAS
jgi:transposase